MKLQNHAYPRRFAVLGAVFAAALFGSVLLGRFSVTPKELFRLLLSRLTETEPTPSKHADEEDNLNGKTSRGSGAGGPAGWPD